MRLELDETRDEVRIYFSAERQTYESGATYFVLANDEEHPRPDPVEVQLGFEDCERLLFMIVRPASKALPADLLASAVRR